MLYLIAAGLLLILILRPPVILGEPVAKGEVGCIDCAGEAARSGTAPAELPMPINEGAFQ